MLMKMISKFSHPEKEKDVLHQERIKQQRETLSLALGIYEFHQSYFLTHKTLEIIKAEVGFRKGLKAFFLIVVKRPFNSSHYNIVFDISVFFFKNYTSATIMHDGPDVLSW